MGEVWSVSFQRHPRCSCLNLAESRASWRSDAAEGLIPEGGLVERLRVKYGPCCSGVPDDQQTMPQATIFVHSDPEQSCPEKPPVGVPPAQDLVREQPDTTANLKEEKQQDQNTDEQASTIPPLSASNVRAHDWEVMSVHGRFSSAVSEAPSVGTMGSMASMSLAERDALQKSVQDYVRLTLRGRVITFVREIPQRPFVERLQCTIAVNVSTFTLHLVTPTARLNVGIQDIAEAQTVEVSGRDAFSQRLLDGMSEDDSRRLVRITYRMADSKKIETFHLLEESFVLARGLRNAIRVLRAKARKSRRLRSGTFA